ncbi:MAG: hypothetical protein ACKVOI_18080 [Dongiaceae bacterium]
MFWDLDPASTLSKGRDMQNATAARVIVAMGLSAGALLLAIYGISGPLLMAALGCVFAAFWAASRLVPKPAQDPADYKLNLLARLDDPDPAVHHQAENERALLEWRREH